MAGLAYLLRDPWVASHNTVTALCCLKSEGEELSIGTTMTNQALRGYILSRCRYGRSCNQATRAWIRYKIVGSFLMSWERLRVDDYVVLNRTFSTFCLTMNCISYCLVAMIRSTSEFAAITKKLYCCSIGVSVRARVFSY